MVYGLQHKPVPHQSQIQFPNATPQPDVVINAKTPAYPVAIINVLISNPIQTIVADVTAFVRALQWHMPPKFNAVTANVRPRIVAAVIRFVMAHAPKNSMITTTVVNVARFVKAPPYVSMEVVLTSQHAGTANIIHNKPQNKYQTRNRLPLLFLSMPFVLTVSPCSTE